jgi:hypothetical protein
MEEVIWIGINNKTDTDIIKGVLNFVPIAR